jgi:glycosyltransferase involved in cell wall biosynthesis
MKKKVLIVSTVSRQFYLFEKGNIGVLKSLGYEIHCAAHLDMNDRLKSMELICHHIPFRRNPLNTMNVVAFAKLFRLVKREGFDMVHSHSPVGGVLGRLAAFLNGVPRNFYTAHGFHFYRGSSWFSWLVYYPVECLLSYITDVLFVINAEDHKIAQKLKAKKVIRINGIGINLSRFAQKKPSNGVKSQVNIIMIGEHIERKNYTLAFEACRLLSLDYNLVICGKGDLFEANKMKASAMGLANKVSFLGYRDNIPELLFAADIFLATSIQEGLPVSIMEAMAVGLPFVSTNIRGHIDLASHGGGILKNDAEEIASAIELIVNDIEKYNEMSRINQSVIKNYSIEKLKLMMSEVYR